MFQFTEDCLIGIEALDADHRHLFELLEQAHALACDESVQDRPAQAQALFEELNRYADLHFKREEEYMLEICDPELPRQRTQHTYFRETVSELLYLNMENDEILQQTLVEMSLFLARWLYHHILGSDIMIGKMPPLEEWMLRENPCKFSEEYLIGVPHLDAEHKELFRLVGQANALVHAYFTADSYDEVIKLLDGLKEYTKYHFRDEEAYMELIGYDGLDAQKRAHEAFIDKLEQLDLDEVDENPQKYLHELIEFLLNWLVNHILYTDKKIPPQT